jgi:hypothetical protein
MTQLKPKKVIDIVPKKKVIEMPKDNLKDISDNYYQAVGVISGHITFDNEIGYQIEISGKRYLIYLKRKELSKCIRLDKINRLLVYPRFIHFPKRDDPYQLSFSVIAAESHKSNDMFESLKDNEFQLRGIWQFIPVCRTPVITVLQNYNEDFKKRIAKLDDKQKCKLLKAIHCPLFWRDSIVSPYRFRKDSESQPDRYFISIKARLDFNRESFMFDSLLGLPSLDIPNGYRLSKKMKAEVIAKSNHRVNPINNR